MCTTFLSHYDITIDNDIARDAHCEITMGQDIALIIPYFIPMEVIYLLQIIVLQVFWSLSWQPMLCDILVLFIYWKGRGVYRKWG